MSNWLFVQRAAELAVHRYRIQASALLLCLLLTGVNGVALADCPDAQRQTAASLADEAAATVDEIDRLILLKRSVKVCSDYNTWLALGKVELELENYIDAAYAFENAVDFYRRDDDDTFSIDEVQRQAVANGWLAETYLLDGEVALAVVATQEAVGGFGALGLRVPKRLLEIQARLDDEMSGADAGVLARSFEIQHQRASRGIGVRPRLRVEDPPPAVEAETLALVSDYTGEQAVTPTIPDVQIDGGSGHPSGAETPDSAANGTEDAAAINAESPKPDTEIASDSVPTEVSESRLNIPVLFEFDSDILTETSRDTINHLGEALAQLALESTDTVQLIGHTDATGPDDYNMDLSRRRAASVAETLGALLADQGRADVQLVAEGRGETELRYTGNHRDDHRRNRRVEVVVRR